MDGSCQAGRPAISTRPDDGRRSPASRWSRVDLPAPFGPSRPVIPAPMLNVMSLTATTLPYQRDTRSRTIGWVGSIVVTVVVVAIVVAAGDAAPTLTVASLKS